MSSSERCQKRKRETPQEELTDTQQRLKQLEAELLKLESFLP